MSLSTFDSAGGSVQRIARNGAALFSLLPGNCMGGVIMVQNTCMLSYNHQVTLPYTCMHSVYKETS